MTDRTRIRTLEHKKPITVADLVDHFTYEAERVIATLREAHPELSGDYWQGFSDGALLMNQTHGQTLHAMFGEDDELPEPQGQPS